MKERDEGINNKKAQANLIVAVLIILIVLVVILIVWNTVNPLIKQKSDEVEIGGISVNLEVKGIVIFENGATHVTVNRKTGGDLDSLRFVFYDEVGNAKTIDDEGLDELETKRYEFSDIEELGKISKVSVFPITNEKIGIESEKQASNILEVPSGVVSWWKFPEINDLVGSNDCTLSGDYNCGSNESLDFDDKMTISFWINDDSNRDLVSKGSNYKISIENKKIKFESGTNYNVSDEELVSGWNHVGISIDSNSKIYINNKEKVISIISLTSDPNSDLIVYQNIKDLMIFNKSVANFEGIYNNQKR